ncbi:MAG TPA: M20/M25/M40 family metallo-hydrolase [Candidatus Angelobacter sp.]|nr:M20/M25/M40 family metallo-hydrolase [Candidatus Angelobacter sp.]
MRPHLRRIALLPYLLLTFAVAAVAQKVPGNLLDDMQELVQTPAVPGYEQELAAKISERLHAFSPAFSPKTDSLGDVIVTLGSGSPHRLLVAPMDEPGFVVSAITNDGYLRVQRLPQATNLPLFNELHSAQPVRIWTTQNKWIHGVVAGVSVHLQPGRQNPPSPADLDNVFIDIGASSAEQARAAGVDILNPLVIDRTLYQMGYGKLTSPAIGDRIGVVALIALLRNLDPQKLHGTLTVAFVGQQWTGSRGQTLVLNSVKPDEMIQVARSFLRRAQPAGENPAAASSGAPSPKVGSGVLLSAELSASAPGDLVRELQALAVENKIPSEIDVSIPQVRNRAQLPPTLPVRQAHMAVATEWPSTPGEFLDANDIADVVSLLQVYLQGQATPQKVETSLGRAERPQPAKSTSNTPPKNEDVLRQLVEEYGVSGGHEKPVRDLIEKLLPPWAKTETDDAGNLILRWGSNSKAPHVLVVAHQDEIGYEVRSILPDGRLELQSKGGGVLAYFLGHSALVHSNGVAHPGVLELPEGWDKPEFKWPRGQGQASVFHLDTGASNPAQVAELMGGIKVGDFVTVPKEYHKLLGTRASARAFDDRIGCAALVSAAWSLGRDLKDRNVTFVWSTSEELGLDGAAAIAKRLAEAGQAPEYVFAVDTFVSSDSPIESKRFADAELGKGFVVRAVDNSNIIPLPLVNKVVSLARAENIPVQYGVTGGGNDGSAFVPYGSIDVALGWPLRYSHSPGEVIDTHDLDALARILIAIARKW